MKKQTIVILLLFVFNGCAYREFVFVKPDSFHFAIPQEIKPLRVKVKNGFVIVKEEKYKKYITLLRGRAEVMEQQIQKYEELKDEDK